MRRIVKGLVLTAAAVVALCAVGLAQGRFQRALDGTLTVALDPANPPASLVGTQQTVTATVTDASGPVVGATVTFTVSGANSTTDTETTDNSGNASFTYTGTTPGEDTIDVHADLSGNTGDASATKTWTSGITVSKTASGSRSVATTYSWSISKGTSTPSLSFRPGHSGTASYTIVATRTVSQSTASDEVSGTISIQNDSTIDQSVVVTDQVRASDGSARGTAFTTNVTVPANNASAPVTVPYDITFTELSGDSGGYTNHVDISTSDGTVLASADVQISFTTQQTTTGASATISDADSCPSELSCGDPQIAASGNFTPDPSGTTLGTATDTATITYTRGITNNTLCAAQGNATQDATVTRDVNNTATVTPGDGSSQGPQQSSQVTVTVSGGQCLTAGSDTSTALTNKRTFSYTLQKKADQTSITLTQGAVPQPLTYTLTATRTVGSTTARVAGLVTVTNNSTLATSGLTIVDTVTCPGATGGTQTITPGASLGPGQSQTYPYDITFVPGATSRTQTTACTSEVDVSASGNTATATLQFALPAQNATNPTSTITDTVTQCPVGLTCTPGSSSKTTDSDLQQAFKVIITVRNNSFCGTGTIVNQARLTDSAGTAYPPQTASVNVTGSCAAAAADLAIFKTGPDSVATGESIPWKITVANLGPKAATSVVVTDPLPSGTSFVSATPSQGTCSGSSTVTCSLGNLAFGGAATITITARADKAATVTNTATVSGAVQDPLTANNTASSTVTIGSGGGSGGGGGGSGGGGGGGGGNTPGDGTCKLRVVAPGFYVGIRTTITVTATRNDGTPIGDAAITLTGKGGIKAASEQTDSDGQATFVVHPVRAPAFFTVAHDQCGSKTIRARPSDSCAGLSVTPQRAATWNAVMISVAVRLRGQPVTGVRVQGKGAGAAASGVTNGSGALRLRVVPRKQGIFRITVPGVLTCSRPVAVR